MATPLDPPPGAEQRRDPWTDAPTEVLPSVTAWTPVPPPPDPAPARPADPWAAAPAGPWGEPVSSRAPVPYPAAPQSAAAFEPPFSAAPPAQAWPPASAAQQPAQGWPPPSGALPPVYGWAPPAGPPVAWGATARYARPSAAERRWAAAAHALPLVSHWVGPLLMLLTVGRRSETVRRAAAASFNWEVTAALLVAVSLLALRPWPLLGPVIAALVVAFSVAMHAYGALVAARGEIFEYPALPFLR